MFPYKLCVFMLAANAMLDALLRLLEGKAVEWNALLVCSYAVTAIMTWIIKIDLRT